MITSSPCSQLAGVATFSLAVSWQESSSLRISAKFVYRHRAPLALPTVHLIDLSC